VRAQLSGHAVYAYMVLLSFWAVRKIETNARALEPALQRLTPGAAPTGNVFAGMGNAVGPVALTAVLTAVLSVNLLRRWEIEAVAILLPYLALPVFPIMTLFWVYVVVLVGLDRLGRQAIELGPFPEDTSLGLRPVGALAFSAFLIFCAATGPFLLVNLRDRVQLIVGLTFFLAGVGVFFLSMWRLHRQMVEAKARHLAWVRGLYGEAFAPLRPRPTLEALQARAPLVSAAEALEKRAVAIQEWPFDDRTMGRIVAISTGVVSTLLGRFALRALGL
jgi:multisubunit Na+/H+ antiporter MnhC subunit